MAPKEPMTPREVLGFCREKDVKAVDLRFVDLLGLWQHFTIPRERLDDDVFADGLGFDGSSIRGWQVINESDAFGDPDFQRRIAKKVFGCTHSSSPVVEVIVSSRIFSSSSRVR